MTPAFYAAFRFSLAIGASAAFALPAAAYQVSPMIYDLEPSGAGAAKIVRVENTNDAPITIEMVAEKRFFDEKGIERREPADGDFILFPPQAIVPAGGSQAIRVQYVGAPSLATSVTYTVTIKQVPVQLPTSGASGVQFVFNFSTVANIVPPGAKAQIAAGVAPGAKGLALTLRNDGNKYANLGLSSVIVSNGGFTKTYEGEEWRQALGASWILPGGTRVISLPAAAGAPGGGAWSAQFTLVEPQP